MITPYRVSGIVLDIGTGDGRFVSSSAKAHPDKFFIGIDANTKPLEKLSTKITRKPAKGGLPNAMFVQAAVEDLPAEFDGIASEIYINFPWGSLLRAVATGEASVLYSLRRILIPEGRFTIAIGIDPIRDRSELDRLDVPEFSEDHLEKLIRLYEFAGLGGVEYCELDTAGWAGLETSWARKLSRNDSRRVFYFRYAAIS